MFGYPEFGASLSRYLKLSDRCEESVTSGLLTLINISSDDNFRKNFSANDGINFLITHLNRERKEFSGKIDSIRRQLKEDQEFGPPVVHIDDYLRVESTLVGQCLCVLTKYEDCIDFLNAEGLNEHIMNYIKIIFEIYALSTLSADSTDSFEQFIGAFLTCLTHLLHKSRFNKKCFLSSGLLEPILKFWRYVHHQYVMMLYNTNVNSHKRTENVNSINFGEYLSKFRKESTIQQPANASSKQSSRNCNLSPTLIKTLMLVLVEFMGNVIYDNDELKRKYIYTYNVEYLSLPNDSEYNIPEKASLSYETNCFIKYVCILFQ